MPAEVSTMSAEARRILVIQGHPDAAGGHFCHRLGEAYAEGARAAGVAKWQGRLRLLGAQAA